MNITPDQATSSVNAWIAAGVSILTTLCLAAAVVLPRLAALKAQVEALFQLHGENAQNLVSLAIATPPPAAPEATAAIQENTAATEANTDAQLFTPPASLPQ